MDNVVISAGGYRAEFSPIGGACLRLTHLETGAEILRTPKTPSAREAEPFLYGNPVLFPPNRIRGGRFTFGGREYVLPVNEKETGCCLHGTLHALPFERTGESDFLFRTGKGEYLGFPHAFSVERSYRLGKEGLVERFTVRNLSPHPMPFFLAYHTTFRLPFLPRGKGEECSLLLSVGREQARGGDYLPTGEWTRGEREEEFCAGNYFPFGKRVSAFFEGRGEARLSDGEYRVVYGAAEQFRYRLLWANGGDFVVIEPQTCAIDCFHLDAPAKEYGLIVIPPDGKTQLTTYIRLEKCGNIVYNGYRESLR